MDLQKGLCFHRLICRYKFLLAIGLVQEVVTTRLQNRIAFLSQGGSGQGDDGCRLSGLKEYLF